MFFSDIVNFTKAVNTTGKEFHISDLWIIVPPSRFYFYTKMAIKSRSKVAHIFKENYKLHS